MIDNQSQLEIIRSRMADAGVDAWIVPLNDPHQSEYVAAHWKMIPWLSGFTGSAATIVVTQQFAGLWTDSRYFLQAEKELENTGFQLMKLLVPHTPEYLGWMTEHLGPGKTVGINGQLVSMAGMDRLKLHLRPFDIQVSTKVGEMESVWFNRPSLPNSPVFRHPIQFSGLSVGEKVALLREKMSGHSADMHLITALDEIAWLFNLRGSDVEFNPVFYAWAVLEKTKAHLFIADVKLPTSIRVELEQAGVQIHAYDGLFKFLAHLPAETSLLLDIHKTNQELRDAIPNGTKVIEATSLAELPKSLKNPVEIANARKVMERDGVALLKLYRWLEAKVPSGAVSEAKVGAKLAKIRASMEHYFGESFPAIAGFKGNGAIVHYRPDAERSALLSSEGMFLLDSGGQYLDGTTDITRTTIFGKPTPEQKFHFTLVLKGHIGLSRIRFPKGTCGAHLSILARQHLWRHGLNYGHGTGHGVGSFLNVHEGPQGISPALSGRATVPFQAGMITSNEPGFYLENQYGIRIENLVLAVESEVGEGYLEFETLSLFPIEQELMDMNLLDVGEKQWLNEYHAEVLRRLSPYLDEAEKTWLAAKCQPMK